MQIIDNKALLLRLRDPDKVINAIPKSKAVGTIKWLLTGVWKRQGA